MRTRNWIMSLVLATVVLVAAADVSAQNTNPRFGVWKLKSDAPPPSSNIMTYEPWGDGGMKITVESVSRRGESKWSYSTLFDGQFRPVEGQENAETAVEIVNERTTRISNKRDGRVTQVIINTLSEDGDTISNEYVRLDEDGKITGVGHAVYERIQAAASPTPDTVFLADLTWTEVRDAVAAGTTTIIFPTGGTEQNGPHMVLGKHHVIMEYTAEQIARRLGDTLVAPVLDYVPEGGVDPPGGHMRYAGTVTLPNEYFMKVAEYAARSFRAHGFTDIVFLGDSGGNQGGLAEVAEMLNEEWSGSGVRVHHAGDYYTSGFRPGGAWFEWLEGQGESAEDIGSHAGILGTSKLLALDPTLIRTDNLAGSDPENGVRGDPRRATAEYGRVGLEFKIEAAVAQIRELMGAQRP